MVRFIINLLQKQYLTLIVNLQQVIASSKTQVSKLK